MNDTAIHMRYKNYLLLCALLILIIGVVATAYVGEAIQLKDSTVEFHKIKVSIGSGGTLLVFVLLSGWVFYLGAKLKRELNVDDMAIYKAAMRHKNYLLLCAFFILIIGVAVTVYAEQSILFLLVFVLLSGWVFYLGTKLKVKIIDASGERIIEIRRIPRPNVT